MHVCLAFALLLLCWQTLASAGRSPIWPQPSNIHLGEQVLWVDRAMTATFYCGGKNAEALFSVPSPGTIPHYYDLLKQTVVSGSTMLRKRLPARTESSEDPQSKGQIPEQDILRQAVRQTLADIHSSSLCLGVSIRGTRNSSLKPILLTLGWHLSRLNTRSVQSG